ncbi:hypothetical protein VSH64_38990 [Amycolatopsis rhabdoformis]|uniref:Serine hydrolase n=1 Tax=Amycolatopsis rhabdoformis TaxID=1448059 RepID=A0ABZ1I488_9PSEU|nr:hypothetical protein [Amycolatopsis rhabdoformis]WSE28761.1 hypothetical protein VSH64_38990 [Amycolatopsis rhabdoformis]
MRKVNILFLVGLCLGALVALVFVVAEPARHIVTALGPTPVAAAGSTDTSVSAPPPTSTPPSRTSGSPKTTPSSSAGKPSVDKTGQGDRTAALESLVPQGHVSAVVYDRTTGATTLSVNADRAYTSASLVKLLIAVAALENGNPAGTVKEMLSRSDDTTASTLWVANGETKIVTDAIRTMGLKETHAPTSPGRWGDTEITANDITRIYQYLLTDAPATVRTTILAGLHSATEFGADGFRQYFGIPDAAGPGNFAVKQGWSCCRPTRMLHTSGLVNGDRYIVTVLTEQPQSVDYDMASDQVTAVVKDLLPLLGK